MQRASARRTSLSVPRLLVLAAVPILFGAASAVSAQSVADKDSMAALISSGPGSGVFSGASSATPASPGVTATSAGTGLSEVLRGNGSCIGYKLSRGNIIPQTVSVRADGRSLHVDRDYWLDAASGNLIFAQAMRAGSSISVYYRYLDGPAAASSSMMPSLQLNFGQGASLGLMYNTIAGDGSGMDTSLYGLALNGKLGGNSGSLFNGLAYFSQTQATTNVVNSLAPSSSDPSKPKSAAKPGVDHLITQEVALKSGNVQFHANFQDVGKNFAGFQSLKASSANNKAMLDQLTTLESEKGIKRLGFGLNVAGDTKSKLPDGLSLQWNKIDDGKGAISEQSIAFNSKSAHFNFSAQDVAATFSSFKGLREADKAQLEREKGLNSTRLGFGLNFAANKAGGPANGLDFDSQNFKDKTGSLARNLISLNTGGLGFSLLNRRADAGFKRLNDLTEADKTVLALDLYRQFDPTAKAEQITALDRAQVAKEAGLSRDALRLDDRMGKTGQVSYSQLTVSNIKPSDSKGGAGQNESLRRESISIASSQFALNYTSRRSDAGFGRMADIADVEKNHLALDTRRMFDPDAKIEQVTQKDRDLLAKEAGIARTNLQAQMLFGKSGKRGTLMFGQYSIADQPVKPTSASASDTIRGTMLGFSGRTFQLNFSRKEVGAGFNRMADLSDIDRQQFGNTRGLSQQALNGLWQIDKKTKLTFSTLEVAGTHDAVATAEAAARKDKKDVAGAARIAASGFNHINAALETSGLSFSIGQAETARDFSRAADLPLPAPDKHQIAMEQGTRRSDYAFHFAKVKGMIVDGSFYDASDAEKKLGHQLNKLNARYDLGRKTSLTYQTNTDLATVDGKKTGLDRTVVTFNQEIGKNFLFSLLHDSDAVYDKDTPTPQSARTDAFHFETPKNKPNSFSFDTKRIAYLDGKYENSTNLNLHAKPTGSLTLSYSREEIDRGQDAHDTTEPLSAPPTPSAGASPAQAPSETSDALDVQWQATKQFAVVFGFSQKETTDNKNGDTVSVGLMGDPIKDVTMTAKFDEVHNDGKNTKDVADFALSNAKPFNIGCLKDVTFTARYASLNDKRKLQNETMAGRASWKLWKNEFLLDYGGLTKQNGEVTIARVYSFMTDPNPKKWFHAGFYYKSRTMVDGTEKLIRRFTADWRLNKSTNFVYTFGTLPEDDKGNILPQIKADVEFKHSLKPNLLLDAFYRSYNDGITKKVTRSLGLGIEGNLDRTTKFGLAYSIDALGDASAYDHSNHYHFLLDHQIDADHFLTLSSDIRSHDGKGLQDDVRANIDFRIVY